MSLKIHFKAIDSLTIKLYPDKKLYNYFIETFLDEYFPNNLIYNKEIGFLNRIFTGRFTYKGQQGYPITLICKGEFILSFTKKHPKNLAPIELKIIQPNTWHDPVSKLKKIIAELSLATGPLTCEVSLIDVSVNYSGWLINDEVANRLITTTKNVAHWKDKGIYKSLYIGTAKFEIPLIKIYNRSKNLRENKSCANPIEFFSSRPSFNEDFWNFEITFHTGVFKSRGIKQDLDSVIEAIPSLWNYAMTDFAKIVKPGTDEACDEWKTLTDAVAHTNVKKLLRVYSRKKDSSPSYRRKQIKDAIDSYWKLDRKMKVEDIIEEIKAMYRT